MTEAGGFDLMAVVNTVMYDIESDDYEVLARAIVERVPVNRRAAALRAATDWLIDHPNKGPYVEDALRDVMLSVAFLRLAELQGDWLRTAAPGDLFTDVSEVPDFLDDDAAALLASSGPADRPQPPPRGYTSTSDDQAPPFDLDLRGVPLALVQDDKGVLYAWRDGDSPFSRAEAAALWAQIAERCQWEATRLGWQLPAERRRRWSPRGLLSRIRRRRP